MAISYLASDVASLGENLAFSLGTTPSDGDVLILQCQTAGDEYATIEGLGFTIVDDAWQGTNTYLAYKVCASESSGDYDFSTAGFNDSGTLSRWSGVDTTVPILDWSREGQFNDSVFPPTLLPTGGVHLLAVSTPDSISADWSGDGYTELETDASWSRAELWSKAAGGSLSSSAFLTDASVFVNNVSWSVSLNPAGQTPPAVIQTVRELFSGTGITSAAFTGRSYTAGSLLVAMCAVDKTVGTWSTPTGWTLIEETVVASTSGQMVWRIATGDSNDDVTFSWSTGQDQAYVTVLEIDHSYSTPTVLASDSSVSDTADTGKTVAPTNPGAAGALIAWAHIDTSPTLTSMSGANRVGSYADSDSTASGVAGFDVKSSVDSLSVTSLWAGSDQNGLIVAYIGEGASATVPDAVDDLAATPGDTEVALTWTAPADGGATITDYEYRVDGGTWTSTSSASPGYTVTGLTNGVEYDFEVRAVNSEGSAAASNLVSATPAAATGFVPQDGFTEFLTTWTPHSAWKLNSTDLGDNFGSDGTASDITAITTGDITTSASFDGLDNRQSPPQNRPFDTLTLTDVALLAYLPSGLSVGTVYGLFHNGGGTNAQSGFARVTSTGIQIAVVHNTGGTNQDNLVYEIANADLDAWFMLGFQFSSSGGSQGDMALWVNGVKEKSGTRAYQLAYGSGNPYLGDSSGDEPTAAGSIGSDGADTNWGAQSTINGSGILLAQVVGDNPNATNTAPPGNGDSFYTDYYSAHNAGGGGATGTGVSTGASGSGTATGVRGVVAIGASTGSSGTGTASGVRGVFATATSTGSSGAGVATGVRGVLGTATSAGSSGAGAASGVIVTTGTGQSSGASGAGSAAGIRGVLGSGSSVSGAGDGAAAGVAGVVGTASSQGSGSTGSASGVAGAFGVGVSVGAQGSATAVGLRGVHGTATSSGAAGSGTAQGSPTTVGTATSVGAAGAGAATGVRGVVATGASVAAGGSGSAAGTRGVVGSGASVGQAGAGTGLGEGSAFNVDGFAVSVGAQGSGTSDGVRGVLATAASEGSSATSTASGVRGVIGTASSIGSSGTGTGVGNGAVVEASGTGQSQGTAGTGQAAGIRGVVGQAASSSGAGSGTAAGVRGVVATTQSSASPGDGSAVGVAAAFGTASSVGAQGSATATGVRGVLGTGASTGSAGSGSGLGEGAAYGVTGVATSQGASGAGEAIGVRGVLASSQSVGGSGDGTAAGVRGVVGVGASNGAGGAGTVVVVTQGTGTGVSDGAGGAGTATGVRGVVATAASVAAQGSGSIAGVIGVLGTAFSAVLGESGTATGVRGVLATGSSAGQAAVSTVLGVRGVYGTAWSTGLGGGGIIVVGYEPTYAFMLVGADDKAFTGQDAEAFVGQDGSAFTYQETEPFTQGQSTPFEGT